jgi:alpha-N-acetylglucosaminidase
MAFSKQWKLLIQKLSGHIWLQHILVNLFVFTCIRMMQGWIFHHHQDFWQMPQIKAVLTAVPIGRMLVLDLFAEVDPLWERTESFFGQPFIWCMLHNFGGNLGMYGAVDSVAKGAIEAMANQSTIVGTGLTPEGIEQNDVIYELMNEMGWRRIPVNVTDWVIHYATRRYGHFNSAVSSAWVLLIQGIYNCTLIYEHHCHAVPVVRPGLTLEPIRWYDVADIYSAWDMMVGAAVQFVNSTTFRYDLVDLTRQVLQEISWNLYDQIIEAYNQKNVSGVRLHGQLLLKLFDDMDEVLGTDEHYLLGTWLKQAKSFAKDDLGEALLYEFNARNQLTLWGPNGEILDYANKMWNGLVGDYYKSRWTAFIDCLETDLVMNVKFDKEQFDSDDISLGRAWTMKTNGYPDYPQGDTWSVVQKLHQEYRHYYKRHGY